MRLTRPDLFAVDFINVVPAVILDDRRVAAVDHLLERGDGDVVLLAKILAKLGGAPAGLHHHEAEMGDQRGRDAVALALKGYSETVHPLTLEEAVLMGLDVVVDLLARPGYPALGAVAHPLAMTRLSTDRV